MADPFEILARSSVDLPAIMGQASDLRARRLKEMMLGREMQEQDRMFERKNKLLTTMSRIKAPGSSPQTEGGGPVSGVGGGAGSAPSPTSYARKRSFRDENAPLLQESIGDPEQFAALSQHLDALDAPEKEATKQRMEVVGNLALWADTPEKWEQAIDFAEGQGIDLSAYRGKFSPATRQSAIAMAGHTKQYLEQTKPVNMAPGGRLVDPTTGRVIAEAPFAPRPVTVGEGQTVVEYQPGGGGDIFSRMIGAESGGRQFAADGSPLQSSAGALGIAQVMPGTAPEAAQLAGLPFDENRYRTDPQYNAALGKAYFEKQLQDFGDPALAVAAYNAGPGAVRNAVAKGGADGWINHVPAETQAYVSKVMGGGSRVIAQGKPKQGYQVIPPNEVKQLGLDPSVVWQRSPTGQVAAVPGQPKASKADQPYSQSAIDAFDRAIDTADRLKKHPGLSTAVGMKGVTGGLLGGWVMPGTDAADFTAELDAMKAQVFLPMVQSMKGMGALSNAEGQKLTDAIGALSPKMSEKAFVASLDRVMADLRRYRDRGATPTAQTGPMRIKTDSDYAKLKSGALFIAPDGTTRRKP
jgi:hypothetical protein